ncbi:putative mediator of RNA polymerase II transcription subunit 37c [Tanacetum coccineum]
MAGWGAQAPTIGIDLGTTYSCVAVWKHDRIEIIPNDQGNRITPSCVAFTDKERFIGDGANNQIARNPTNTVFVPDAKRLIGRRFSDAEVQDDMKLWPFKVIEGPNDTPKIAVRYKGHEKQFSAEEISSMVLTKMREVAETYIGKTVRQAVITVPAYFNDCQRQATKDAATIAGLKVVRMINEPTAAAIAYGIDNCSGLTRKRTVLVFDLGGGTFDVSLLTIEEGGTFKVKAVAGDTHLGGQDFDNGLVKYCAEDFKKKWKKDVTGNERAMGRLKIAREKAKRSLSIPKVRCMLQDFFFNGKELCQSINPDEAVAYGAAVMAAKVSGQTTKMLKELVLVDVTPMSLGIESRGGVSEVEDAFKIDANGILTVTSKVVSTEKTEKLTVTNHSGRFSQQEIEKMVKDAEKYKLEDQEYKRKVDAFNDLEDFLYVVKKKIMMNRYDISAEVLRKNEYAVNDATEWLSNNKDATIEEIEAKKFQLEFISKVAI